MGAQIAMNSPVTKEVDSVRGPHVDDINELWAGLLYLRKPEDNSTGGELNGRVNPKTPTPAYLAPKKKITINMLKWVDRFVVRI
eukprot:1184462-Prorocentrum_minimum.AAC.5